MLRILAIGNSFSDDATARLAAIARADSVALKAVNLYVGGCTLEQHAGFLAEGGAPYTYELDGVLTERRASLPEVLAEEPWDVITLQQASHMSGRPASYEPYLTQLLATVRAACPKAAVWFHQTWAYEVDSDHAWFPTYDNSQETMHRAIGEATREVVKAHGLPVLPVGEAMMALRQRPSFDPRQNGIRLTRDGYHLNLTYGRYAAGAVWYECLTGRDIRENPYCPEDTDPALIEEIRRMVHGITWS